MTYELIKFDKHKTLFSKEILKNTNKKKINKKKQ